MTLHYIAQRVFSMTLSYEFTYMRKGAQSVAPVLACKQEYDTEYRYVDSRLQHTRMSVDDVLRVRISKGMLLN